MMRSTVTVLFAMLTPSTVFAIDRITCLQAKSKFLECTALVEADDLPLRACLAADGGFSDCRRDQGLGASEQCLPAKSQYGFCRTTFPLLTRQQCMIADSGFKDCL